MNGFSPWLPEASHTAFQTDLIFLGLCIAAGLIVVLVAALIIVFSVRYRAGSKAPRHKLPGFLARDLEIGWTFATLIAFLFFFGWAAAQDFTLLHSVPGALTIHVMGKQWMWKAEYPGGQREIDSLHVPLGTPVRLVLNSQDVIHSFYVPALRLKRDAVPGLTQTLSFTATRAGTYPLYCAEFCGTSHSHMLGSITVEEPEDYARWLTAQPQGDSLAAAGAERFRSFGCSGCHMGRGPVRAPDLTGIYGHPVPLADGRTIIADEAYIRDSILNPKKDVASGYAPVMPSFAGRISESALIELVAYIRSLANDTALNRGGQP
jgi:cytochrome c oxidase subunit 2